MKVLLLHASLGAGHKRAAQALGEVFAEKNIQHEIRDLLEFLPVPVAGFYSRSYNFLITGKRGLWKFVYETMDRPKTPYQPARSFFQKWQFRKLRNYAFRQGFSCIVSTHFTPSALLTDWRADGGLRSKIYSVVTDHVAHRCWKRTGLDHYFVPSLRVAGQLIASGISEEKVTVSGIPISLLFSSALEKMEVRKQWDCRPEETVALVLCSALDEASVCVLLRETRAASAHIRLLVSTGSDPGKESRIRNQFRMDPRMQIFGFSSRIAEMMKASDLVITKPGGLIVSESLAVGVPLILLPPIPGQEEANAQFAVENGAAVTIPGPESIRLPLAELLADRRSLSTMSAAAQGAGMPGSARVVVDRILADCLKK